MNEEIHASGFRQYSEFTDATKETGLDEWKARQVENAGGAMVQDLGREGEVLHENNPRLRNYHERVHEVREELERVDKEDPTQSERYVALCRELAEAQANYTGDWTLLELLRVLDPKTLEKYSTLIESEKGLREGVPGLFDKERTYRTFYEPMREGETFSKRVADVFLATGATTALDASKKPHHLGVGRYGTTGTVFTDAVRKEPVPDGLHGDVELVPLNERQKNIIEAHEKAHGLFSFNDSPMGDTLREVLDAEALTELQKSQRTTYLREPDEILARMSQLRNYFGMGASDEFTLEHLTLLRTSKYVTDTELDNDVSSFLSCITDKTQDKFIQAMNKFPM